MGKRILIADDAVFMRTILKRILSKIGYEVVGEAANGKEAVEKYKELKPDIVTLDIVMPVMDGIAVLKEIKAYDKDAKVFMISAMGQEMMIEEAMREGALGFIEKPFKESEVIRTLTSMG